MTKTNPRRNRCISKIVLSKITLCKTNLIIAVKYIHIKKFLTASFNDFIVVGTFQVTKFFSFLFLKKKDLFSFYRIKAFRNFAWVSSEILLLSWSFRSPSISFVYIYRSFHTQLLGFMNYVVHFSETALSSKDFRVLWNFTIHLQLSFEMIE